MYEEPVLAAVDIGARLCGEMWEFPKIRGNLLGVPITRVVVF